MRQTFKYWNGDERRKKVNVHVAINGALYITRNQYVTLCEEAAASGYRAGVGETYKPVYSESGNVEVRNMYGQVIKII